MNTYIGQDAGTNSLSDESLALVVDDGAEHGAHAVCTHSLQHLLVVQIVRR